MTDITKLAQSWKTAAHKAKQANDLYLESKITLSECVVETKDYLDYSDNPNNLLALVEALEKAQQERENWRTSFDNERFRADKLAAELKTEHEQLVLVAGALITQHTRANNAQERIAYLEKRLKGTEESLIASVDMVSELESRTFTTAATDVLAERQRQITAEGWTPEHDDEYQHCEMAVAAACYIMADDDPRADVPELWPWPSEWWKPTDVRRDLVKAGALILAEIERLDRAAGIKWEAE